MALRAPKALSTPALLLWGSPCPCPQPNTPFQPPEATSPCPTDAAAGPASSSIPIPVGLLDGLPHHVRCSLSPALPRAPAYLASLGRPWHQTITWCCRWPHHQTITLVLSPRAVRPVGWACPCAASSCCSLMGGSLFNNNFLLKCNFLLVNCKHPNLSRTPCPI